MEKIVVATSNAGKLKEFKEILQGVTVLSMAEAGFVGDIEETGLTFAENALLKARTVTEALGLPALADDSGLEVFSLGGEPGIYSARYSGEPCDNVRNRALLLENLKDKADRKARFVCSVCLYYPNGEYITAEGYTEGIILQREEGERGFGYDCLFFSNDLNKSFGLASDVEKNGVSHRGRAIRALVEKLKCKE